MPLVDHGPYMVLWDMVRVDFRSEKNPMAINRSLDVPDGFDFNGFGGGWLPTCFEDLKKKNIINFDTEVVFLKLTYQPHSSPL